MRRSAPAVALSLLVVLATIGAPGADLLEHAVAGLFAVDPVTPAAAEPVAPRPLILTVPDAVLPPATAAQLPQTESAAAPARARGALLCSLYASFIALQTLDVHSTLLAIDRGAVEANPIMAPFTDHPPALVAVKMGTAAGILYMTERVRKRSRFGAIVMMAAFNSAYASVVANNYRIADRLR
jgi:hypothetical protein